MPIYRPLTKMDRGEIEEVLISQYGLTPEQARDIAVDYIGKPFAQQQLLEKKSITEAANRAEQDMHQMAPTAPMPLNAHATTPAHLQDANLSAWQRYSQLLDSQPQPQPVLTTKDPALGQSSGKRKK